MVAVNEITTETNLAEKYGRRSTSISSAPSVVHKTANSVVSLRRRGENGISGTQPLVDNLYQVPMAIGMDSVTGLYYERNRNHSPSLGSVSRQEPKSRLSAGVAYREINQDLAGYPGAEAQPRPLASAGFRGIEEAYTAGERRSLPLNVNGANTYQFVMSNPVGNVDPWGLLTQKQLAGIVYSETGSFLPWLANPNGSANPSNWNAKSAQQLAQARGDIAAIADARNGKGTATPSYPTATQLHNDPAVRINWDAALQAAKTARGWEKNKWGGRKYNGPYMNYFMAPLNKAGHGPAPLPGMSKWPYQYAPAMTFGPFRNSLHPGVPYYIFFYDNVPQ